MNSETPFAHLANDPFFRWVGDPTWNACIGPQGGEENYLDGYIEAATLLADALVENELLISRDTLVLPILYNARHAIELSLKYALRALYKVGVISAAPKANHDIAGHLSQLSDANLGDMELRSTVQNLEPFIKSLAAIDEDGQGLRYGQDQEGNVSLHDRPLANLLVIRSSLAELAELLKRFKNRIHAFCDERLTGTSTKRCSRTDLAAMAYELSTAPDRGRPEFLVLKEKLKSTFGIGSKEFGEALKIIESHRQLGQFIGKQFSLKSLSDEKAQFVATQWSLRHPPRPPEERVPRILKSSELKEKMFEWVMQPRVSVELLKSLTMEELVDVETIYYIGRDKLWSEFYEERYARTKQEYSVARDVSVEVDAILNKTNFLEAFAEGVKRLGRPALARALRATRPDLFT